jgi:hypothetical protein
MNQFLLADRCIVEGCGLVKCCSSEVQNLCHVSRNLGVKLSSAVKGKLGGGGVVVFNTNCCFWEKNEEKIAGYKRVIFKLWVE